MSKPPLWEVMVNAYASAPMPTVAFRNCDDIGRHFMAAEIRAVAEWIEQRQVEDYAVTLPDVREVIGWLTAEADRAERGEVEA